MAVAWYEQVEVFMREWPRKVSFWRKPRYLPLQYRLILSSSGIVTLLLVTMALVVSYQQGKIITEQVERRGIAIAQSLAATSKAALTTYDYIALSRNANQAVQEPDISYVIIHDKEGRVAGYSGRADLEGKFLSDQLSIKALSSSASVTQKTRMEVTGTPVLDIAVPVSIPGSERPWGVVRIALSLAPMYRQINQLRMTIYGIGIGALIISVLTCIWFARRITNPIGILANATISAARGNLDQEIRITTGDEVEVLAENFSSMIREILLQRLQLESHLAEITDLQNYLNKLLTTMSDGLLSVDMEGRLITLNPAARSMLMCHDRAVEPRESIAGLFAQTPELLEYVRGALAAPHSARQRELRLGSGRDVKNVIVAPSVLAGKDNAPQQLILNLNDITELKKLEGRFRQTERLAALGTLSAGMAHEIRNPLSAIKTFVQLLPRKLEKPGFLEKFQRTVPRELERINRLVDDLLELARAPRYHCERVEIQSVLQQALELFEEELLSSRIRSRFEISGPLPLVWVNSDQITKAFNNIIRNAIQAMPDGGELSIHFSTGRSPYVMTDSSPGEPSRESRNGCVVLVFSDTGVGMEPEDLKSLFNPFFTTKDSGTGLGMAITHKVITEHGGQIEVESAPGRGTRFIVYLPAHEESKPACLPPVTLP